LFAASEGLLSTWFIRKINRENEEVRRKKDLTDGVSNRCLFFEERLGQGKWGILLEGVLRVLDRLRRL
jgi:hypothetical protein